MVDLGEGLSIAKSTIDARAGVRLPRMGIDKELANDIVTAYGSEPGSNLI